MNTLGWIHSRAGRTAENNYRGSGGTNYPRYMNSELDGLIDRFSVAIDIRERIGIGSQIIHHMTDQLVEMPLLYDVEPTLIANRVKNVTSRQLQSSHAWNAHEWDVQ
jgi:ABC-type transport system substrate-binding protein